MLTVKQVATALGIDERSVREKLQLGSLKGTKKTVGQKDQWFVHQRDLDAELVRRGQSPINQPPQMAEQSSVPPESMTAPAVRPGSLYQPEATPPQSYFAPPHQPAIPHQHSNSQALQPPEAQRPPVMTPLFQPETAPVSTVSAPARPPALEQALPPTATMQQKDFEDVTDATVVETMAEGSIFENESTAASGGMPQSWRNEDLESQVASAAEKIMKPLMDRVQDLTKEIVLKDLKIEEMDKQLKLLPDFEKQKADLLKRIEDERQAAEIQYAKTAEKEEEAQKLAAEVECLRLEAEEAKRKADEAALNFEQLQLLKKQMEELKRPWWKKWFESAPPRENGTE